LRQRIISLAQPHSTQYIGLRERKEQHPLVRSVHTQFLIELWTLWTMWTRRRLLHAHVWTFPYKRVKHGSELFNNNKNKTTVYKAQ